MSYKDDFKKKVGDAPGIIGTVANKILSNKTVSAVRESSIPSKKSVGGVSYGNEGSFKQSMDAIKESYGIPNNSELASKLESEFINRFRVNLTDTSLAYLKYYIFIGKPDLYLFKDRAGRTLADSVAENVKMSELIKYKPELYAQLCQDVDGTTAFLTALSNRCTGISIQDASMSKEESSANNKGIKQVYPTTYLESMANIPTSISFRVDRNGEVIKIIDLWIKYMEGVKEGTVFQSPEDDALNRMSYTCPIWIFACEENGTDIVFYTKLTGNYPVSIPYSAFSYSSSNQEVQDVTVNFNTALFDPLNPLTLVEFNNLSKSNTNAIPRYVPIEDRDLSYYWTKGAYVTRDATTNKLQLKFVK